MRYITVRDSNGKFWQDELGKNQTGMIAHYILEDGSGCRDEILRASDEIFESIESYAEFHAEMMICPLCLKEKLLYHRESEPAIIYDIEGLESEWWFYRGGMIFKELF